MQTLSFMIRRHFKDRTHVFEIKHSNSISDVFLLTYHSAIPIQSLTMTCCNMDIHDINVLGGPFFLFFFTHRITLVIVPVHACVFQGNRTVCLVKLEMLHVFPSTHSSPVPQVTSVERQERTSNG